MVARVARTWALATRESAYSPRLGLLGLGVSARDRDRGPPHTARDVRDARAGLELLVHVGDLWEVFAGERAHQPRPVEIPLRLDRVGPLHGDTLAGPVRIDELRKHAAK